KIELKVGIYCERCKRDVLKAITKLPGIDKVSVDVGKGMVTVIGDVDPVCVTKKVRKTGKVTELVSVGPPAKEKEPKETKPTKASPQKPLPPCCKECQLVAVSYTFYDGGVCSIL
ncbi:hypothetical protein RJ639_045369, partial [Escallonia herrerae]